MEKTDHYEFGIVGLGVMGRNLLLNMADHGFAVAGLDMDAQKISLLKTEVSAEHVVQGTTEVAQFVDLLRKPRAIMLLVPAGKHVDLASKACCLIWMKEIFLLMVATPSSRIRIAG